MGTLTNLAGSLPALALCFAASSSLAEAPQLSLNSLSTKTSPSVAMQDLTYVDRHIVLAIDLSNSVDASERLAIQEGIARALLDEDCGLHFNGYSAYAVTMVYFANRAEASDTIIVTSQADAVAQISSRFWDVENDLPVNQMPNVGSGTNMLEGIDEIDKVFSTEEELGIHSLSKLVILVGDAVPSSPTQVQGQISALGQNHRATVHALPIVLGHPEDRIDDNGTVRYFNDSVRTGDGVLYMAEDFPMRVAVGALYPVTSKENFYPAFSRALDLTNG